MCMRVVAVAAFCVGVVSTSQAADLYRKAPQVPVAVPVAASYSWTGVYVGAHLGYAWSSTTASAADAAAITATYGGVPEPSGVFGGGQIGYNHQFPNRVVLGVELSGGAGPGFSDSVAIPGASLEAEGRWYAALVGRLGYAMDRWLPYVTGGGARAGHRVTAQTASGSGEFDNTHTGWTAGAGLAYAVTPKFSVGAEYRFFDFNKKLYGNVETGSEISAVTLRGDYRF